MHSIKDLENHFGLSYWKARKRVGLIRENFEGEVKGGQNSKYYLPDNGLAIMDRILELENQNYDLNSAVEQVRDELKTTSETAKTTKSKQAKIDPKYVQRLEDEVEFLREELQRKNNQIQQLLPAAQGNGNGKEDEFKEMGFFQLVKRWLNTTT